MPPCSRVKLLTVLCVILFLHHTDYNVAPLVRVHIATYYGVCIISVEISGNLFFLILTQLHINYLFCIIIIMTLQFLTCQLYISLATVG